MTPPYDPWIVGFRLAVAYASPFLLFWLAVMPGTRRRTDDDDTLDATGHDPRKD